MIAKNQWQKRFNAGDVFIAGAAIGHRTWNLRDLGYPPSIVVPLGIDRERHEIDIGSDDRQRQDAENAERPMPKSIVVLLAVRFITWLDGDILGNMCPSPQRDADSIDPDGNWEQEFPTCADQR